jgi:transposase
MYIELTDEQWAAIEFYLPPENYNGRPRRDDRSVINGILYVLKTGCQWPALPKEYGVHYSTCWRRLRHWQEDGVWQRIADALLEIKAGDLAQVALDTSYVKAKKGRLNRTQPSRENQQEKPGCGKERLANTREAVCRKSIRFSSGFAHGGLLAKTSRYTGRRQGL